MALQLSANRPRQLQYCGAGLRTDLRLLEVDAALLDEIKDKGCACTVLVQPIQILALPGVL